MSAVENTIVAIATPMGEGALGVIRISGTKALEIAEKIFKAKSISLKLSAFQSRHLYLGNIIDDQNELIDEVTGCAFFAPKSYTGENCFELYCHGNPLILKKILALSILHGARLAEPGEFTKQAFLNGRMDLSQAEAVVDLIQAKTELQRKYALRQIQGELSERLTELQKSVFDVMVETEANIDFPDDVPENINANTMRRILTEVTDEIQKLLEGVKNRRLIKEGLNVVLMGEPNVGKSSLLNALAGKELAIVTEIPGTTRDAIEYTLDIEGIPVRFTDTAGLRSPENIIEQKGIEISQKKFEASDLVLWIFDASRSETKLTIVQPKLANGKEAILIFNKIDQPMKLSRHDILKTFPDRPTFEISALYGTGIDALQQTIENWVVKHLEVLEHQYMINQRHEACLKKAHAFLVTACSALEQGLGDDLVSSDLRHAVQEFDAILGKTISEEMLHAIFSRFCIGK